MLSRLRRHVAANLVGYLALFVALGGTATAATYVVSSNAEIAPGTVEGSAARSTGANDNIVNGTITAPDLALDSVTNGKLAPSAVTGAKVLNDSLTGYDIKESKLGPVPDESNLWRLQETFPADTNSHYNTTIFADPRSDFEVVGGCFNLGDGGDFRLVAGVDSGHGDATVNAGFYSSHAWPVASPTPSNIHTTGADITSASYQFFETDQGYAQGDQYVGTAVLDDADQTLTLNVAVYVDQSQCQIHGTAVLKSGPPVVTFAGARRTR